MTAPRAYVVGLPVVVTVSDAGVAYAVDTSETAQSILRDGWTDSGTSDRQRSADAVAVDADHLRRLEAAAGHPVRCPECGSPVAPGGERTGESLAEGYPSFDDVAAADLDGTLRFEQGSGPHGYFTWEDVARRLLSLAAQRGHGRHAAA